MQPRMMSHAAILTLALQGSARAVPVTDGVLGNFIGTWAITGTARGKPSITGAEVRAQFGGAFLEMHIQDPAAKQRYEARVFFGRADDGSLIVHWMDYSGGETSRTLGTGKAIGDAVSLNFPYPDGAFRDFLRYDRTHDRWRLLIQTGPADHPTVFSDWYFDRRVESHAK